MEVVTGTQAGIQSVSKGTALAFLLNEKRYRLIINANVINQAGEETAGFQILASTDVQATF
jgi:hypothetical protein